MNPISLDAAVSFVWREADLLDRNDYRAWLALWTESGHYVVPTIPDVGDPAAVLNIAYDDREMRDARVKRLLSGFSISAAPPARTVRTVSRFVVVAESGAGLTLRAAQHLVEYKFGRTRIIAADVIYQLTWEQETVWLDGKTVQLINCDDAHHGIGYLL